MDFNALFLRLLMGFTPSHRPAAQVTATTATMMGTGTESSITVTYTSITSSVTVSSTMTTTFTSTTSSTISTTVVTHTATSVTTSHLAILAGRGLVAGIGSAIEGWSDPTSWRAR